jgi:hypothetical protein
VYGSFRPGSVIAPVGTLVLHPGAGAPPAELLLVTLDGLGAANLRVVRVLPELLSCSPLPKEVPAAIEFHLNRAQAIAIGLEQLLVVPVSLLATAQLVLLADKALDPRRDALVAHVAILEVAGVSARSPAR